MRHRVHGLTTFLALLLLLVGEVLAAPAKFEVTQVAGAPTVRPFKSLKKLSVKVGDQLAEKSRLALKDGDLVVLKTPKGDELTFKDKTFAQLKELSVSGDDKKVNVGLHLGNVNCEVKKLTEDSAFIIRTPSAVAGVRGTEFDVEVVEDGSSEISVEEGEVEVEPATGEGEKISVGAGQAVTVKNDGSVKVQRSASSKKASAKKAAAKKSNKKSSEKKSSEKKSSEKKSSESKKAGSKSESKSSGGAAKSEAKTEAKSTGGTTSSDSSSTTSGDSGGDSSESDSSGSESSGSESESTETESTETESTETEVATEEVVVEEVEEVETEVSVDEILEEVPETTDIEELVDPVPTYIIEFEPVK